MLILIHPGYHDDLETGALVDNSGEFLTEHWQLASGVHAHNNNDAVAVSATFILADVALLFVASDIGVGFTHSEQAVVINMILLFFLSVQHARGWMLGIPLWVTNMTILVLSTVTCFGVSVVQYVTSTRSNERAAEAVHNFNFDALDGL